LRDLPPFPPIAARLMRLISEEEPHYKDLADLIRADPAFAAEILRLANSPVFGLRSEIGDIMHAIAVLGLNRLRGLIITVAMKEFVFGIRQHEALRRCWRHNLACALVSEVLAEAWWLDKGLAYTAGLLHDIGMLALVASQPEQYAGLINNSAYDPASFLASERELFGIDHCEAGRWLLEDWGFPAQFQEVAAGHHAAHHADGPGTTKLVHFACKTADTAGFAAYGEAPPWDPEAPLSWLPEPARIRFNGRMEGLPVAIACKINLFDCDFLT